jgi:WS/DGAT/MGAT family acyltransferase
MGPVDCMFWRLEQERSLRSTTLAVSIFDVPPDRERLRRALLRTSHRVPRLRQRVVELPAPVGRPLWMPDLDFDIDYHLRWIAAPGEGDLQGVFDVAAWMAMQAFDRSRPLWEFVVVERLEGGQAALIQKMHHSVGDGAAGLALIAELYDLERDATHDEPEPPPPSDLAENAFEVATEVLRADLADQPRAALRGLGAGLALLREDPWDAARQAAGQVRAVGDIMRSGPGPLSPIMHERSSRTQHAAWTLPNGSLAAAAKSQGCTFNAAYLSAIVGGLIQYHDHHGVRVDVLRGALPISLRGDDEAVASGNRLSIARFEAPMTERDPAERMRRLQALVNEQREPASLGAFEVIANMVNVLPIAFVLPLVLEEMRKSDFVATSMPGPPVPLYLAGSRVERLIPFGPTAGAAINLTLLSYGDEANVGLTVDAAAVPDRDVLAGCLQRSFDEIGKLA